MALTGGSTKADPQGYKHRLGGFSVDEFKSRVGKLRGLAASNLFVVQLPTAGFDRVGGNPRLGETYEGENLNILCNATEIPGRNIDTMRRQHGVVHSMVANGKSITDVTLNFYLTNDYYVRSYFENWQNQIIENEGAYNVNYYKNYAKSIKIYQLRRGESFPIFNKDLGFDIDLPPEIENRIPGINPVELFGSGFGIGGIDIGDILNGNLSVALFSQENIVYSVELLKAYPSVISPISLSNEADGLSQMSVSITYESWKSSNDFANNKKTFGDTIGDAIDDVFGAIVGALGF